MYFALFYKINSFYILFSVKITMIFFHFRCLTSMIIIYFSIDPRNEGKTYNDVYCLSQY